MSNINELPSLPTIPVLPEMQQSLPSADSVPVVPASQVFGGGSATQITISDPVGGFFTVKGEGTKVYRENLKKLGGKWNHIHHVWSFEASNLHYVKDLVDGIAKGTVVADPIVARPPSTHHNHHNTHHTNAHHQSPSNPHVNTGTQVQLGGLDLPTIGGSNNFESVGPWSIFIPVPGMKAKIQIDKKGAVGTYSVISVTGSRKDGYTALITDGKQKDPSKLEITNAHWQVRGLLNYHTIRFESN